MEDGLQAFDWHRKRWPWMTVNEHFQDTYKYCTICQYRWRMLGFSALDEVGVRYAFIVSYKFKVTEYKVTCRK